MHRQHLDNAREGLEGRPNGHVDPGETPIAAAARELTEETGYVADSIDEMAVIHPDTGRLSNRLICLFCEGSCFIGGGSLNRVSNQSPSRVRLFCSQSHCPPRCSRPPIVWPPSELHFC